MFAQQERVHGLNTCGQTTGPPMWRRKQLGFDIARPKLNMGKLRHFDERIGEFR